MYKYIKVHGFEFIEAFEVGLYDTLIVNHYKKDNIHIRHTPVDNSFIIHIGENVTNILFKGNIKSAKKLNNLLEIIEDQ